MRHITTLHPLPLRAALLGCGLSLATAATAWNAAAAPPLPALVRPGETPANALHRIAGLAARGGNKGLQLPAITSGVIATPGVTIGKAPALPEIDIAYTAPSGLYGVQFVFTSPSGAQYLGVTEVEAAPGRHTGTVKIQNTQGGTLGLWSEPGPWTLAAAAISGFAGEQVYYTQAQLAAIFPSISFAVTNRNPADITPPVAAAGVLLTPSISLGSNYPYAAAEMSLTDDVSGTATAEIFIISPDQQYYTMTGSAARPQKADKIVAGLDIGSLPNPSTGSWTIAGYTITDAAGNQRGDFSADDIKALFGTTTFQVTE